LGAFNEDPSKFQFGHRQFNVITAVSRENLSNNSKDQEQDQPKSKDKRNLYLAREGCKLDHALYF